MIVQRVEKHIIKQNNEYYDMLDNFCFLSKNLYNHANFLIREEFIKNGKWLRYNDLDKILKIDEEYPDYKNMPTAQTAQQTLKKLDGNWSSFFKSIKDWKKNKSKYSGMPRLPKYKKKNGRFEVILTNQNVKLKKDGLLHFPKTFNNFTISLVCVNKDNFIEINQIRINKRNKQIEIEIIYSIEIVKQLDDNGRYVGIDIGVDNLAAVTNNCGLLAFVINGRSLKSINQYYNKQKAHYQKIAKQMNNQYYTERLNNLTVKRNHKIDDYMHKASRYIIEFCNNNDIHSIVIGYNKNWKQKSVMKSAVNQNFVQIPMQRFIEMITYKSQEYEIKVIEQEESYTSGTSFLDGENPIEENYDKSRRKYRGLFVSNSGIKINADLNGSYQILRKAVPNAFADGIEGVALHPIRVNIA